MLESISIMDLSFEYLRIHEACTYRWCIFGNRCWNMKLYIQVKSDDSCSELYFPELYKVDIKIKGRPIFVLVTPDINLFLGHEVVEKAAVIHFMQIVTIVVGKTGSFCCDLVNAYENV